MHPWYPQYLNVQNFRFFWFCSKWKLGNIWEIIFLEKKSMKFYIWKLQNIYCHRIEITINVCEYTMAAKLFLWSLPYTCTQYEFVIWFHTFFLLKLKHWSHMLAVGRQSREAIYTLVIKLCVAAAWRNTSQVQRDRMDSPWQLITARHNQKNFIQYITTAQVLVQGLWVHYL